MINILGYVNNNNKIDKNKTWFDVKYNVLVSKEITHRNYFALLSRFENNVTSYYLLLSDVKIEGCGRAKMDDYGRVKIHFGSKEKSAFGLSEIKENVNVEIIKKDGDFESELYELYPN